MSNFVKNVAKDTNQCIIFLTYKRKKNSMDELHSKVRLIDKRPNERSLNELTEKSVGDEKRTKSQESMIKILKYYSETLTYEEAAFIALLRELNIEDYTYALKLIREKHALTVKTKSFLNAVK